MAGKSGGSWKVAYADFVTAMMAFFLVMWIGAQDVKVRQSVANYFINHNSTANVQNSSGSFAREPNVGPVPKEGAIHGGMGPRAAAHGSPSPTTKAVLNWLTSDPQRWAQWKQRSAECLAEANSEPAMSNHKPLDRAAQKLGTHLRAEFTGNLPSNASEVFRDLLFSALNEVNWTQAADHIYDQRE